MDNKIGKEELERLKKFEDTILGLKEEGSPKYSIDYEMESQIRYDALIDNFGVDEVSEAFRVLDFSKDDLVNPQLYLDIYDYLETRRRED